MEKKIGIVGSAGQMGRWFTQFFSDQGWEVKTFDINDPTSSHADATNQPVVMLATPIAETKNLLQESYWLPNQLIVDISAVKTLTYESWRPSYRWLSIHPLFGPRVQSLKDQHIIVCPREGFVAEYFLDYFRDAGATLITATADYHDRFMARLQLSVVIALTIGGTILVDTLAHQANLERFLTPMSGCFLSVVGRMLSQRSSVYEDIVQHNPYFREVFDQFRKMATCSPPKFLELMASLKTKVPAETIERLAAQSDKFVG